MLRPSFVTACLLCFEASIPHQLIIRSISWKHFSLGTLLFDTMATSEGQVEYFDAKYLDPKFAIVKADPSVDDVVKSLRTSDYMFMGGATAGTWVYGFMVGKPIRGPTAAMCASVGFTFGMMYTMQNIRGRLLGYRENGAEVKKWGLAPVKQPRPFSPAERRLPKRQPLASEFTKPKLDWDNYK